MGFRHQTFYCFPDVMGMNFRSQMGSVSFLVHIHAPIFVLLFCWHTLIKIALLQWESQWKGHRTISDHNTFYIKRWLLDNLIIFTNKVFFENTKSGCLLCSIPVNKKDLAINLALLFLFPFILIAVFCLCLLGASLAL